MIGKNDKRLIIRLSKKYKAKRVFLFGSSIRRKMLANDIDIGVEGIPAKDFFNYYGELMMKLSKPLDVVDIGRKAKISDMIREEGIPLYG